MTLRSDSARRPPLDDIRVVDLTTEMGVLAPRLLTGFGAQVTRIEPPGGDPLRQKLPLATGNAGRRASLYWLHFMRGRRSIRLDLGEPGDRGELRRLLAQADIIVESQPAGHLESLGLGYEDLSTEFPALIWTSITPFGREGPRAGWSATDLIGLASGGLLSICGDPDRPPLRPSVEQAYAQVSSAAATATLAALHARNRTGRGQLVDVSMQEAVANCLGNNRLFFAFDGLVSRRAGGGRAYGEHGSRLVYACRDGHIAISRTPDTMEPLHLWLREKGMDPEFDHVEWSLLPQSGSGTPGPEKMKELEASLEAFFALGTKHELYEEGQSRGLLICPVSTPADLLENEQLIARGYFSERFEAELGRSILVPGPPVGMEGTPWRHEGDAGASGSGPGIETGTAGNEGRRAKEPASGTSFGVESPEPPVATPEAAAVRDARGILEGIRVADFSWVGVGPIATQLLAALGAEVIRVESTARLDVFRSGGPRRGDSPVDASAYFASCNRDKLGMTLHLGKPGARDVALRLAARSDVLIESFRPGFMDSAGLSYGGVRGVNPAIIMMSCSMEGATGPHARFKGFGLTLQATVGFTHFTGWPDRAPAGTGTAYTDWVATHTAAMTLLAALEHRQRTGKGQYIDLSQLEASIWALDAEILRYTASEEMRPALGNRHEEMVPHGVFPCRGDDRWIAIAVREGHDWRALAELLPDERWRAPEYENQEHRRDVQDQLEAAVAAWTAGQDRHQLAALLQSRGIPAHAVSDVADVHRDPQLRARGHFWPIKHPIIGDVEWDAPAFRLSDTPLTPGRPAPRLGEHNEHIYREILGYGEEELAELIARGVLD